MNINAPNIMPSNKGLSLFPPWTVRKRFVNANDGQLEITSDNCQNWALRSGGLVLAGLFAEIFIAYAHPKYNSFWEQWGTVVADAFVFAGVFGEILFSRMGHWCDRELDRRTKLLLADATRQAGEADKRAAEANVRAEELALEIAKLNLLHGPRILTEDQYNSFIPLKDRLSSVVITWNSAHSESRLFAGQISSALLSAGVKVLMGAPRVGLGWSSIYIVLPKILPDLSEDPLYMAFNSAGIPAGVGDRSQVPMGDLPSDMPVIMVGEKSILFDVPPYAWQFGAKPETINPETKT